MGQNDRNPWNLDQNRGRQMPRAPAARCAKRVVSRSKTFLSGVFEEIKAWHPNRFRGVSPIALSVLSSWFGVFLYVLQLLTAERVFVFAVGQGMRHTGDY